MTASLFLSMAAFALAASISPGPVNIVALSCGAQYGFRPSLRHVTGATLGFTLLLLLIGLGLHELLHRWPYFTTLIQGAGVAFLLFMAYKLATDDGRLGADRSTALGPSMVKGAMMQWLNPKAWLASIAGMGAYAADGAGSLLWQFTAIYFVICYLSIGCWAFTGTFLGRFLQNSRQMRHFNRLMAVLLASSALYLLWL
nr:LysE family translocator [uncultured Halomonas sp.]